MDYRSGYQVAGWDGGRKQAKRENLKDQDTYVVLEE